MLRPPHEPFEMIETDRMQVACDGGEGALGHPRIFMHIEPETGRVVCPYCSREYVNPAVASAAA